MNGNASYTFLRNDSHDTEQTQNVPCSEHFSVFQSNLPGNFLLSVHKMSFIHGVLTTKLSVGFSHISICQIYLIKNDCLCKELSTHPLFSNVGLDFYVSLASFFWQLLLFFLIKSGPWLKPCRWVCGGNWGLFWTYCLDSSVVPEAIWNSGERWLPTDRKPDQDKQGFPGRKRGIHFVFKLKNKTKLNMSNLKPVQKYRETNIIFSSWSIMFILFSWIILMQHLNIIYSNT